MLVIQNLGELIEEGYLYGVKIRRELHEYPETGNDEFVTAAILERELEQMGIESFRPLPTAVVGMIKGGKNKTECPDLLYLRADMDALPIGEETGLEYASKRPGHMHACGHDVHMAVMLAVARVLSKIKLFINHDVKFIFQPDEEGNGGAARIIEKGIFVSGTADGGKSRVLGFHVYPQLPAGVVGLKYGKVHAASIMFKVTLKGRRAHGARPEDSKDCIAAAGMFISAAQTIISRNISPLNAAVLSFGKIKGGDVPNAIADKVVLEGIIRGEDEQICQAVKERLREIAEGLGLAMGVQVNAEFKDGYPALVNDDSVLNFVRASIKEGNRLLRGNDVKVWDLEKSSMTVDDFAYFLNEAPGAYLFLGSGYQNRENSGIHTANFEVDEACIKTGIQTVLSVVLNWQ